MARCQINELIHKLNVCINIYVLLNVLIYVLCINPLLIHNTYLFCINTYTYLFCICLRMRYFQLNIVNFTK